MSDAQTVFVQDLLQAKFEEKDHKALVIEGRPPMTYVEDEAVMDRLDDALGFGGWQVTEATPISDTCVRLTIGAKNPATGEWTYYTDFGYVTNDEAARRPSKEPLKEAWTDAFRRTARLLGVARYVYAGEAPAPAAVPSSTNAPVPQPVEQDAPVERPPLPPNTVPYQDRNAEGGDSCPAGHGAWTVKAAGTSKAGKDYRAFWKCDGKTPAGRFCEEKPSKAWVDSHPIAS